MITPSASVRCCFRVFLGAMIFAGPTPVRGTTLIFQQGVNGYSGTADTTIRRDFPTNQFATLNNLFVGPGVGAALGQGLLRFDNIFGDGSNQVPSNAAIYSGTLIVRTTTNP